MIEEEQIYIELYKKECCAEREMSNGLEIHKKNKAIRRGLIIYEISLKHCQKYVSFQEQDCVFELLLITQT